MNPPNIPADLPPGAEPLAAELARLRSLFETTLAATGDGILVVDQNGRVSHYNDRFVEIWRIPAALLAAKNDEPLLAFVLAQLKDGDAFMAKVRALYAQPELESHDQLEFKDGRVLERYSRPQLMNHRCVARVWSFRDVTGRKQAEAGRASEQHLLRQLLDHIPDLIFFKDTEGRFIHVSRSSVAVAQENLLAAYRAAHPAAGPDDLPSQLTNINKCRAYIIGKKDSELFSEERARLARHDEQQIIQTGQPMIGHLKHSKEVDGRVKWRITSKMPWRDQNGKIIGVFGISKDVTAIKQAEAQIEQVNEQLRDASRQAGMSEVATSVLHNVGNVLNSINVSVSVLADYLRDPHVAKISKVSDLLTQHQDHLADFLGQENRAEQVATFLKTVAEHLTAAQTTALAELALVTQNVEHIKGIVAMQQQYARMSGRAEKLAPADIVEDALRMHLGALQRQDVQLTREYDPATPPVVVEKHKVLQILMNLIHNAKTACDAGSRPDKHVVIRIDGEGAGVSIAVQDNGVGISAENLPKIFQFGFATRQGGHGFGLHNAILTAGELGGTLQVHSDGLGTGATFTLKLPFHPPLETAP